MMGHFDLFVSFTDKNSCFEIKNNEFWWKCQCNWEPTKHKNIGIDIYEFPYVNFH